MIIPQSTIEPFGYTGIPTVSTSDNAGLINMSLDAMFYSITRTTHQGSIDSDACMFAKLAETHVIAMGAKEAFITPRGKIIGSTGILYGVSINVRYVMPDLSMRSRQFHFASCGGSRVIY